MTNPRIQTIREALDDPDAYAREAHLLRRQGIDKPPARTALDSVEADMEAAREALAELLDADGHRAGRQLAARRNAQDALARLSAGKDDEAASNTDGTYTCRDCLYQHSAQPTPPAAPTAPPRTPPTA